MRHLMILAGVATLANNVAAFDLSVTVTTTNTAIRLGETIRYTITTSNLSAVAVSGATLINWADPSCQVVSWASGGTSQNVWSNQCVAILPTLPPHGFWNSTLVVKPQIGGTVVNGTVIVNAAHNADDNPDNDTAQVFTPVDGGVLLSITPGTLRLARVVPSGCVLEQSPDLRNWTRVFTNVGLPSVEFTVDTSAPAMFFRTVKP